VSDAIWATDYRPEPYWWLATPPEPLSEFTLPERCDVAIIGSGYSGLAAALVLARNGRDTLVLDSHEPGWGCSTRNGGQVSPSIKLSFAKLASSYGPELAYAIRREGLNALAWVGEFMRSEAIDCDFERVGRLHAAHSRSAFAALQHEVQQEPGDLEVGLQLVGREDMRREIGTDAYYGALIYPAHASLHPGKFHRGLLERARRAGARIAARCAVEAIAPASAGFELKTQRGVLHARELIVASNGYTDRSSRWLRRRVIPICSHIIATEPLPEKVAHELLPYNRVVSDTRRIVFYYRLSEDRRRLLFGGRVAARDADSRTCARRLHHEMTQLFPQLAEARVSRSWGGFVAYTFDSMPHLGRQPDGSYYCLGYCGQGVSLAPYFGTRVAQQLLGKREGRTALDGRAFPTRPLYSGNPWFLPAIIGWYRLQDRLSS
jgi:glycine/D-amino acid oxidase-like deaminating enzyme